MSDSASESLARLRRITATLFSPGGCPWDQKQTPETLCDYVIEEAFELVEAIRSGDKGAAMEELGDVLFLLCFIGGLYEKEGAFTMSDAIEAITAKMIRRHPHVFEGLKVENQEQILKNWERIKRAEKDNKEGVFQSLPKGLPPLLKAYRLNSKAARNHFTWESDQDQAAQMAREWEELQEAISGGDQSRVEAEFGDYLFSVVEYGRRLGVKANSALEGANAKFLARFERMEELAAQRGLDTSKFGLNDWDRLWDEVKAGE